MSGLFSTLYADTGRASIAPEKLMRAQLLQLFYSIRSERMLMEQLHYNLLFRWFVGLAIDEPVWDHSVFSKNRDRLNGSAVAAEFLAEVVRLAEKRGLMSDEHFSVDGTRRPTSRASSGATTPMHRPAIRTHGSTARETPARS
jgi:transposase